MSYNLRFHVLALEEWKNLSLAIREQLKKVLEKRLENPHVPSARLRHMPNCYKIKLRKAGFRLVYKVDDDIVTVFVVSIGKRDKLQAYIKAANRLKG